MDIQIVDIAKGGDVPWLCGCFPEGNMDLPFGKLYTIVNMAIERVDLAVGHGDFSL